MIRWLDQFFCGVFTGHTYIPKFSERRWECKDCLKEQTGWIVDGKGPRKRFDGDQARHQIRRVQ